MALSQYAGLNMMDGWSQAKMRGHREWFDQHGRAWEGDYEVKSNAPTCMITPMFQAPWYPSQQFFREVPKRPNDLRIDYQAILAQVREAHEAYDDLRHRAGTQFHGESYDGSKPPTVTMLRDIGKPPMPLEIVLACIAKPPNGYLLGLRAFDPRRAGDVRLKELLEGWQQPLRTAASESPELAELAAAFADDAVKEPETEESDQEPEPDPRPRRRIRTAVLDPEARPRGPAA